MRRRPRPSIRTTTRPTAGTGWCSTRSCGSPTSSSRTRPRHWHSPVTLGHDAAGILARRGPLVVVKNGAERRPCTQRIFGDDRQSAEGRDGRRGRRGRQLRRRLRGRRTERVPRRAGAGDRGRVRLAVHPGRRRHRGPAGLGPRNGECDPDDQDRVRRGGQCRVHPGPAGGPLRSSTWARCTSRCTTSIRSDSTRRRPRRRTSRRERGADAADHRAPRSAGGARRRRLRDQHRPGRHGRGDPDRLRGPGAVRHPADDRRHPRRRRDLPRAAHVPGAAGARARTSPRCAPTRGC